jgi:FkbM family methyltransferase
MKYFVRDWVQCISKIILSLIFRFSIIFRCALPIRFYFMGQYDEFYLDHDFSKTIKLFAPNELCALDIGARDGEHPIMVKYGNFFSSILCEPDIEEAVLLRKKGYLVIDKAISNIVETRKLYLTRTPHGSSLYEPDETAFLMYNPNPNYFRDHFTVTDTVPVECTTVSQALDDLNISQLDFLKIDVQGAEADIISGFGIFRPLIILSEVQFISLYKNITNGTKLISNLYEMGYINIHQMAISSSLNLVEADCLFIPNHLSKEGKKIISRRENEYSSLMLMFGQVRILKLVSELLEFKNNEIIQNIRDPLV